jgi:DNA-3-methyladenine glycosylase I
MKRCNWPNNDELMIKYHDEEWGRPVHDDFKLFECLTLEAAQAGLSWKTILYKRKNYRKAFDSFNYNKVCKYNEQKIEELMKNKGIVRNRLKINATIINAQQIKKIRNEFTSFNDYVWSFTNNKIIYNDYDSEKNIPSKSNLSDIVSKDLKRRGFKFIGSTIVYAYLQAIGVINDHINQCEFK